jgi:hypothetical protein
MRTRAATGIHLASAALFAGAAAWFLQQQAGYVIASWACHYDVEPIWLLTAVGFVLLLTGGWFSWQALRPDTATNAHSDIWRPRRFMALVALMGALLFLFAILMQAAAALFLPGCVG